MLTVTLGRGLKVSVGQRAPLGEHDPVGALAELLVADRGPESWWSPHLWEQDHRAQDDWRASVGVGVDVDYHDDAGDHSPLPADLRHAVTSKADAFGANLVHLTPRGCRVVFLFASEVSDPLVFDALARRACKRVEQTLAASGLLRNLGGLTVDTPVVLDRARLLLVARTEVDGVRRDAAPIVTRRDLIDPDELLPDDREAGHDDLREAVSAFRRAHPIEAPRSGGHCPTCGHDGCFGLMPDDPQRWYCWSSSHGQGSGAIGVQGSRGWHGDSLDLAAHVARCTRVELLRREGYLRNRNRERTTEAKPGTEGAEKPRTGQALRSLVEALKRGRIEPGLLSRRPPPRPMVFRHPDGKGLAPAGKVWQIVGAGGVGKSTVLGQMAVAVAVNTPLFGCLPVDAGAAGRAVAMLLGEDESFDVWERLYKIAEALGLTEDQRRKVEERVTVVALAGEDVNLQAIDERDGTCQPSLAFQAIEDQLRQDAPDGGYALVLVDPLSRFAPGAEGKHTGAGTHVAQLLERLTRLPGRPAVGITHHTTKEARKGIPGQPARSSATDSRGKTEIPDAARWVCALRDEGDRVAFRQVKSNHTRPMSEDLLLVRDEGGVLRIDSASTGQSTAQVFENEEREARIRRVVEALRAHGNPVSSKNTIVELARPMKNNLGRAAVDLAIGRGLIVQGGTSKAPTFTVGTDEGPDRGGAHPPHPPSQGPRGLGPDYGGVEARDLDGASRGLGASDQGEGQP